MTRHPYGPDELDRHDSGLDEAATRLEEYASASGGEPPMDLSARIRAAIDAEPPVATGWWASLFAWRHGVPARLAAVAGVMVLAVAGALALGQIARNARIDNVGTSPSALPVPTSTPTEAPSPSVSPSPSERPSPTLTPLPTERETPEPSDDEEVETPRPSETDNSGPGGGGGDNSGPGGGESGSGSSGSGTSGSGTSGSGSDD